MLTGPAKAHFAKRVVVVGVESSGTTTLAEALAEHYHTVWVPEYGRFYWEGRRYLSANGGGGGGGGQAAEEAAAEWDVEEFGRIGAVRLAAAASSVPVARLKMDLPFHNCLAYSREVPAPLAALLWTHLRIHTAWSADRLEYLSTGVSTCTVLRSTTLAVDHSDHSSLFRSPLIVHSNSARSSTQFPLAASRVRRRSNSFSVQSRHPLTNHCLHVAVDVSLCCC